MIQSIILVIRILFCSCFRCRGNIGERHLVETSHGTDISGIVRRKYNMNNVSSLPCLRQNFLPPNINKVRYGYKGEKSTSVYSSGFDSTGKFFTVFDLEKCVDEEDSHVRRVFVYCCPERVKRLHFKELSFCFPIVGQTYYDAFTTRWFVVGRSSNELYSGCLRKYFAVTSTEPIEVEGERVSQIPLAVIHCRFMENLNGRFMLLEHNDTLKNEDRKAFTIFRFNDEKDVSFYRSISFVKPNILESEKRYIDYFLDTQCEMLYMRQGNTFRAFKIGKGDEKFTTSLIEGGAHEEKLDHLTHLHQSVFLAVYNREIVKVFRITEVHKMTFNQFNLPPSLQQGRHRYDIVKRFNKIFLCVMGRRRQTFHMFDISSGEQMFEYNHCYGPCRYVRFNWSINEIALCLLRNVDRRYTFTFRSLVVERIPPYDTSLKHFARLTCLKWFNREYLMENLPIPLRIYLGLSGGRKGF